MLAGMALVFGPHDEDRFLAARASLLERFGLWLVEEQQRLGDPRHADGR